MAGPAGDRDVGTGAAEPAARQCKSREGTDTLAIALSVQGGSRGVRRQGQVIRPIAVRGSAGAGDRGSAGGDLMDLRWVVCVLPGDCQVPVGQEQNAVGSGRRGNIMVAREGQGRPAKRDRRNGVDVGTTGNVV